MKKRFFPSVLIIVLLISNFACAHSGRTDSSGGHKDNQNKSGLGGYHYHCGGHPAHLHYNGVCPYSSNNSQKKASSPTTTTSNLTSVNASENKINIVINSNPVVFTENSGFPYVDKNNRTMVPLRVTMEAAGTTVDYDPVRCIAIIITETSRIEVLINSNILYKNDTEIKNDTEAVVLNGRTYLPIRAVLEAAGFAVEWDGITSTVNAYTFQFSE